MAAVSTHVCGYIGAGVPEPRWLDVAALCPLCVCVSVWYVVIAKGGTFGLPKGEEHGGGHGVHAGEHTEAT
jgi:hypothetical protein